MTDPAKRQGEIKPLTSLRGLAAMAVVLQHFSATAQLTAAVTIPSLVPHGYMAVDFFFVLSGFIMAYTYLEDFRGRGWRAYAPFLGKRVARICPLGIVLTLVILALGLAASRFGRMDLFIDPPARRAGLALALLVNLAHLQGFFPALSLNYPAWSISVEFVAYLLFPLLIALVFDGPAWRARGFATACAACLIGFAFLGPFGGFALLWPPTDLARCLVEFSLGLFTYRVFAASPLRRIGEDRWTWLVTLVGASGFLLRIDLLAAASFPFVVLSYALNRGTPARLLATPVPYFLGTISFSIYLVHNLFRVPESALLSWLIPAPHSALLALTFAFLGSLSVLPFAALAYYAVERPGRTAINRLVRRLGRAAPGPLSPARQP